MKLSGRECSSGSRRLDKWKVPGYTSAESLVHELQSFLIGATMKEGMYYDSCFLTFNGASMHIGLAEKVRKTTKAKALVVKNLKQLQ